MKKDRNISTNTQMPINSNIKVINSNLWLVNFDHISNGWIDQITFSNAENDTIFTIGINEKENIKIILVNSQYHYHEKIVSTLDYVMKLSTKQMRSKKYSDKYLKKSLKQYKNYNSIIVEMEKNLYFLACNIELERRKM